MDIWSKFHGKHIRITCKDGGVKEGWAAICVDDIWLFKEQYDDPTGVSCRFGEVSQIEVLGEGTDMRRFHRLIERDFFV